MTTGPSTQPPGPAEVRPQVLARVWYMRPVLSVAADLLGLLITTTSPEGRVTVRLTEVEAYGGPDDAGSHAFRGRNARNAAMFAEPGRLYVYRHLGLHDCVNVVTEPTGSPSAVLLRAGEVLEGADLAWERRARVGRVDSTRQLARGPGRLAVCLGLTLDHNGADVTEAGGEVVVHRRELAPTPDSLIATGPRVGVGANDIRAARLPWRFWLTNDLTVSAYRPAYRSPASSAARGGATTPA